MTANQTKMGFKTVEQLLSSLASHNECVMDVKDPKWRDKLKRVKSAIRKQQLKWTVSSTYDGGIWVYLID